MKLQIPNLIRLRWWQGFTLEDLYLGIPRPLIQSYDFIEDSIHCDADLLTRQELWCPWIESRREAGLPTEKRNHGFFEYLYQRLIIRLQPDRVDTFDKIGSEFPPNQWEVIVTPAGLESDSI